MAHLFQFSKSMIVNLDKVEIVILNNGSTPEYPKLKKGLVFLSASEEYIAHKHFDDPTMEETWNRLKQIAALTRDTESQ